MYLAATEHAVNAALIREDGRLQLPVYYVSKRYLDSESKYLMIEKLPHCLLIASRKLRPYFQAHPVRVLTNYPLRQALQKPEPCMA